MTPVAGQESGLLGGELDHGLIGAPVPVLVAGLAGASVADFQLAVGVQGQVRDCPAVGSKEYARREHREPLVDGAGQRLAADSPGGDLGGALVLGWPLEPVLRDPVIMGGAWECLA